MLAQIAPDMMESLLENTLVEKWKAGIITLNDWNRIPRAVHEDREPAIYVNYYTKPDGSGLSTGEYKDYLLAIEAALTAKNVTINGKSFDMVKEIDHYYKVRTGSKTLFSKSPGWASCRTSLPDFLVYQNKLISVAARDGKVEIRFHGEVGWAIDTDSRIKAHHTLQGSAFWFRLTMCVVSVLWPQHSFELSSFCMFRVMMWNHAEIVSYYCQRSLRYCLLTHPRANLSALISSTAIPDMVDSTSLPLAFQPARQLNPVLDSG